MKLYVLSKRFYLIFTTILFASPTITNCYIYLAFNGHLRKAFWKFNMKSSLQNAKLPWVNVAEKNQSLNINTS